MISPEPGYYKSFRIHLFPIQDEKSELTYLVLHFHLEEQYPEQVIHSNLILNISIHVSPAIYGPPPPSIMYSYT